MHTGGHGKAKSRKPSLKEMGQSAEPKADSNEIEELVAKYAKQNMPQAMIGQKLRDEHNIPYIKHALSGKRLGQLLAEKKLKSAYPQDMLDLIKKAVNMREHLSSNHNDTYNTIRLGRVEAKIWRLTKYYKREGKIAADWKYEPDKAALLIKGA